MEQIENEIVITKDTGCPLIRYNIHDEGGILNPLELVDRITKLHDFSASPGQFPFVYLYGRSKFMVKLYGANIYVEHVQHAIDHEDLQTHLSGRFLLDIEESEDHSQTLVCHLELKKSAEINPDVEKRAKEIFLNEVKNINKEYSYILQEFGEKVHPKMLFYSYGTSSYFPVNKIRKTA